MKLESKQYNTIIISYKEHLETLNFAKDSIHQNTLYINKLLNYLEQNNCFKLQQITTKLIHQYFTYLEQSTNQLNTKKGLSPSHLNRIFLGVDKFFKFLQLNTKNTPPPTKYRLKFKNRYKRKHPNQMRTINSHAYRTIITSYKEYLETLGFAKSTAYDYPLFVASFLEYLELKNCSTLQQITNELVQ